MSILRKKRKWVFTEARRQSLIKAQKEHVRLLRLGESIDYKQHKHKKRTYKPPRTSLVVVKKRKELEWDD